MYVAIPFRQRKGGVTVETITFILDFARSRYSRLLYLQVAGAKSQIATSTIGFRTAILKPSQILEAVDVNCYTVLY